MALEAISSTRFLKAVSARICFLMRSIILQTELYLSMLNFLPISFSVSCRNLLIKYIKTFRGSFFSPRLEPVKGIRLKVTETVSFIVLFH